jgi:hypothetical protein
MPIQPIVRDDNGFALPDRGSETVTKRFSDVGTGGTAITFDVDVKEVLIHIEGAVVTATLTGTVSGSDAVNWTSDGETLPTLPLVKEAGQTVVTVAAPSGTVNVSAIAWR